MSAAIALPGTLVAMAVANISIARTVMDVHLLHIRYFDP